jgi:hypothetical protein
MSHTPLIARGAAVPEVVSCAPRRAGRGPNRIDRAAFINLCRTCGYAAGRMIGEVGQ